MCSIARYKIVLYISFGSIDCMNILVSVISWFLLLFYHTCKANASTWYIPGTTYAINIDYGVARDNALPRPLTNELEVAVLMVYRKCDSDTTARIELKTDRHGD